MNSEEVPTLAQLVTVLAAMDDEHMQILNDAIPADRTPADAVSHLVIAALRRSRDNVLGFLAMADQRNAFCGMPIIRFQLDTAMRLFARTLVDDVGDYVKYIADGNNLRKYKGRRGDHLTDAYLHQELSKKYMDVRCEM